MRNLLLLLLIAFSFGCSETDPPNETTIPENGILIGNQTWMDRNLDVKTFKNGDEIFEAKNNEDWIRAYEEKIPAWSYYENNSENGEVYGLLYNYYAVIDSKGLAPEGWRIPKGIDWENLIDFIGSYDEGSEKLKSTKLWINGGGTNSSGFTALPGGFRGFYDKFESLGEVATFWASTLYPWGGPEFAQINGILEDSGVENNRFFMNERDIIYPPSSIPGYSVRCILE